MRINNNMMAMNTHRQLGLANTGGAKSMEKLSSGFRINRAGDDAAGLSISEKMRSQIRGLNQASRNAQDGISLVQTAEGALTETHAILQRMRELGVQAGNDTNLKGDDKSKIQDEVTELIAEIDRIATTTQFNKQNLLDITGGDAGKFTFQIGANKNEKLELTIGDMQATALTVNDVDFDKDYADIGGELDKVDAAIASVSSQRSKLGATQNRLEHTIKNLDNVSENLQAAESRIRDVDMAKEMMEQTKQNILQQASTAMLAQANQAPQTVLSLLR